MPSDNEHWPDHIDPTDFESAIERLGYRKTNILIGLARRWEHYAGGFVMITDTPFTNPSIRAAYLRNLRRKMGIGQR